MRVIGKRWSRYPFENELNIKRFINMYGLTFPVSLLLPFMVISLDRKQRRAVAGVGWGY
jgi:hypothetical protein